MQRLTMNRIAPNHILSRQMVNTRDIVPTDTTHGSNSGLDQVDVEVFRLDYESNQNQT